MDLELFVPVAVAAIAIGLYVIALWIGDDKTVSMLAGASNLMLALGVVALGLSCALGVRLSIALITNPHSWMRAIGNILREI